MAFDEIPPIKSIQEKMERHLAYQNELLEHLVFSINIPDNYRKIMNLNHYDCLICDKAKEKLSA